MRGVAMRRALALVLVSMLCVAVSASQGGVNESTALEGTGISSIQHDEVLHATQGTDFSLALVLEDGSNVTSVQWITQVCINSGVCYSPETTDMQASDDGLVYTAGHGALPDSSYINWKFVLHEEGGSESSVPEDGFGWKVWSDCWLDDGTWGGSSTECQEEDSFLPGFAATLAMASVSMAALMARRD
jgi:hypothetical protein